MTLGSSSGDVECRQKDLGSERLFRPRDGCSDPPPLFANIILSTSAVVAFHRVASSATILQTSSDTALRRVARRGILRIHGQNDNSPSTTDFRYKFGTIQDCRNQRFFT